MLTLSTLQRSHFRFDDKCAPREISLDPLKSTNNTNLEELLDRLNDLHDGTPLVAYKAELEMTARELLSFMKSLFRKLTFSRPSRPHDHQEHHNTKRESGNATDTSSHHDQLS